MRFQYNKKDALINSILFFLLTLTFIIDHNLNLLVMNILVAVSFFIDTLDRRYQIFQGILIIVFSGIIMVIKIRLWPVILICLVAGILLVIYHLKHCDNQ